MMKLRRNGIFRFRYFSVMPAENGGYEENEVNRWDVQSGEI